MQDLFRYEQVGIGEDGQIIGAIESTGIRPTFADRLTKVGLNVSFEAVGGNAGGWR